MSKPNLRVVDTEQPHARDIARQRIKEWRSNADKGHLPLTNVHDDKGAPVLDRDSVLRNSYPNHVGRK